MIPEDTAGAAGAAIAATAVHVAIVHVPGYICHVVADTSLEGVNTKLGAYVGEQCVHQLLDDDADHVRELLSKARAAEAIAFYFSRVGVRWDPEQLTAVKLDLDIPVSPALRSPRPTAAEAAAPGVPRGGGGQH